MSAATFEVRRLRGNIRNGWTAKGNAILLVMRDSSNAISNDVCQHLRKYGPLLSERRKKDVVPSIAVGPFPISFFFSFQLSKSVTKTSGETTKSVCAYTSVPVVMRVFSRSIYFWRELFLYQLSKPRKNTRTFVSELLRRGEGRYYVSERNSGSSVK